MTMPANASKTMNPGASGWPVDDVSGLARRLPEVDPSTYFDAQASGAFERSLGAWPVLARLMKLAPVEPPIEPPVEPLIEPPVEPLATPVATRAQQVGPHDAAPPTDTAAQLLTAAG